MPRGRAPARGTRRAAAGQRAQNEAGESSSSAATGTTAGPSGTTNTPQSTSMVPTRGGTTTRATRGPATTRFRPKVVRRDEAERDTLARQEEKKAQDRAADEKRARGRSRFRSKRSRGDAMGSRGGFGRIISGASGPFSSGAAGSSGGWGGGWGGGGGGGGGFGGSFPRTFKSESKPGFGQADGSRYREARINADKLNVHTPDEELDSEDEAMMAALGSRSTAVLPMGIYRREHKDEGIVVATTAELEAAENAQNTTGEEESLWVDGDGSAPQPLPSDQSEDGGVWKTAAENITVIKKEPGDSMDLDIEAKSPAEELDAQKEKTKSATPQAREKKTPPLDPEEKMIQTDLNLLAGELGTVTITEEGENGEENKSEDVSNKDGRLYLFQFPPILPPLKQTSQPKPVEKIKAEPDDLNMLESMPAATDAPVDLTEEETQDVEAEDDPEKTLGFLSQLVSRGGMVGQLKVRKSGRVELDWGGQILEMSPAAGMNFLTTAVIVEENDEKPKPGVVGGDSIGMGKIMGRFVLAPTWEEEEDWEVSPEELRID